MPARKGAIEMTRQVCRYCGGSNSDCAWCYGTSYLRSSATIQPRRSESWLSTLPAEELRPAQRRKQARQVRHA
jgi:hypothetical protein